MSNIDRILVALAALSLVVGFAARAYPVVDGLGKAMFGVFLILFFIRRFFGEESAS